MGSYNQAVREAVQLASNLGFLPADAVAAANNLGNPSNTNELAGGGFSTAKAGLAMIEPVVEGFGKKVPNIVGLGLTTASLLNNIDQMGNEYSKDGAIKTGTYLGAVSDVAGLASSAAFILALAGGGAVIGATAALTLGVGLAAVSAGLTLASLYPGIKDNPLINQNDISELSKYFDYRRYLYSPDPRQRIKPILRPPTNPNNPHRSDPNHQNTYRIVWIGGDPLTLDLDGDGIETIAASSGVLFDHNADGIKTTSGWIKADDGLLVRDLDGNGTIDTGRELFGDSTLLADGKTAANGYAALAELDSNADGVVDASDTAFAELKIWQDINQDGISQTEELKTLAELGVSSLNVTHTQTSTALAGGTQTQTGSYTRADGTTTTLADLNLTQDTFTTQYTTSIEVPEELQDLPNLPGMGRLRSLQEAAALSPALADALRQYAAATTRDGQKALIDQVLLEWAKTDPLYNDAPIRQIMSYGDMVYSSSSTNVIYLRVGQSLPNIVYRFDSIPANAGLAISSYTRVLDAFTGDRVTSYINDLNYHESTYINTTYAELSETIYQSLLTQTRLKPYLDSVELQITEDSIGLDFSAMNSMLQDKLSSDPKNGVTDLIELNRYAQDILGTSGWDGVGMLEETLRNTPITPLLSELYAELRVGFDGISASNKEDLILGNDQNLNITGADENDILLGGTGNELLSGGMGDDIISGGAGNDELRGEYGDDTYIFRRGNGHDTISDTAGSNRVFFAGLTPEEITVSLADSTTNRFTFTINDTGDTLSIGGRNNWWSYDTGSAFTQFIFSDGTAWDADEALRQAVAKPTDGNDVLIGSRVDDVMSGLGGNDTIIGNNGNDIIDGGTGDDTIIGGAYTYTNYAGQLRIYDCSDANGNDTYLFGRGDGHDVINDADTSINSDTLRFKEDIAPNEVSFARSNSNTNDLILTIKDTGDSVTIRNYFEDGGYWAPDVRANEIERIEFNDGTVWTAAGIGAALLTGSEGAETIIGYRGDDIITGNAGDDSIDARTGNDTISGGDGDDTIRAGLGSDVIDGGTGDDVIYGSDSHTTWRDIGYKSQQTDNDTYLFGFGDGHDIIEDVTWTGENSDVLRFKDGVKPEDVIFQAASPYSGDLKLILGDGNDSIIIRNWNYTNQYKIERFEFSDGTVLDSAWVMENITVFGTDADDSLVGSYWDEKLSGGAGDDTLNAREGNDLLDGGTGNDLQYGGIGDDVYRFGRGYGLDTIQEADGRDYIKLSADILPDDLIVRRDANNMVLTINGADDRLVVLNGFVDYGDGYRVEQIKFNDGTVWDLNEMKSRALLATDGDDVITGFSTNDVIDGKAGNDILKGGYGSDTYVYGRGSGNDTITEERDWSGNTDSIRFGAGITPADLTFGSENDDLIITIKDTGETLRITNAAWSDSMIERFVFESGVVLSWNNVRQLASISSSDESLVGTTVDDNLVGTSLNSTILGLEGNDLLSGGAGNDSLDGGTGDDVLTGSEGWDSLYGGTGNDQLNGGADNDNLYGGEGNDQLNGGAGRDYLVGGSGSNSYLINLDSGVDTIRARVADGNDDIIRFGEGITPDNIQVQLGSPIAVENAGDYGFASLVVGTEEYAVRIEADSWNTDVARFSTRQFVFSDGTTLTLDQIIAKKDNGIVGYQLGAAVLTGSNHEDNINASSRNDVIYARGGNDRLNGKAGNDQLSGGAGDDSIDGSSGDDTLIGGVGDDILDGGAGQDFYLFNRGAGDDYIENSWQSGTKTLSFGSDISVSDITSYVNGSGQLVLLVDKGSAGSLTMDWFDQYSMTPYEQLPLQYVQFIDVQGNVTSFDLQKLVQARFGSLFNSDSANTYELFSGADNYDISFASMPPENNDIIAYAQTGDLLAAATYSASSSPSDGNDRIVGTQEGDTINAGNGNDLLYGLDGDDYLDGGIGNDRIDADTGNDSIYGGSGNDLLMAGEGDDHIFAGSGNDIAYGGFGNDIYYFNVGDGRLTIEDSYLENSDINSGGGGGDMPMVAAFVSDYVSYSDGYGGDYGGYYGNTRTAINVLQFGSGITHEDLNFSKDGDYLVVTIPVTGDEIRLAGYDLSRSTLTRAVDIYRFADGSILSAEEIAESGITTTGSGDDDYLYGNDGNDTIVGGFGNDVLSGGYGGNDRLEGGIGSDRYLFARGNGINTIVDMSVPGMENRLELGYGIERNQLRATIEEGVFVLQLGEGDALRFEGYDPRIPGIPAPISLLTFSDGTTLSFADLLADGYELLGTPDQDILRGTDGNDRIRGLAGDDQLIGGTGDDIYLFSPDEGVDTIDDLSTSGAENTVVLPDWAELDNISLSHDPVKGELIIYENNTGNELHLTNFDRLDPYGKRAVEFFQFGDSGMTLSYDELLGWVEGFTINGTDGGDTLLGTSMPDQIRGGDGDDILEGGSGGVWADYLAGGSGDDTYIFNKGDGTVFISDFLEPGAGNLLRFGPGINPTDIQRHLRFYEGKLIIAFENGDTVILDGFTADDVDNSPRSVDMFQFDDGSVMSYSQLVRMIFVVEGDEEENILTGTNVSDRLYGHENNDQLIAGSGDDVLTGGSGNDHLEGGAGNDTYVFNLGDGNDTIIDTTELSGENRISFGTGITRDDVTWQVDGSALIISYGNMGDSIAVENFSRDASSGTPVIDTLEFSDGMILTLNQFLNHAPQAETTVQDLQISEDAPFTLQLDSGLFSDADGDTLTWNATLENGDALPAWLSFDPATRTLSGIPGNSNIGDLRIALTVVDAVGAFTSTTFGLTINNTNDAPVVQYPVGDRRAVEDQPFSFQVPSDTFTDIDAGDTLTLSATLADGSVLPSWLAFDAATGTFSGTPDNSEVGVLEVSVVATDLSGARASSAFLLQIVNTNDAPVVLNGIVDQTATEDQAFSFTVPSGAFRDIDAGDRFSYSATLANGEALPAWVQFDAVTATFSGTPSNDNVGSLDITVTVTDMAGSQVSSGFSLLVTNVNDAPEAGAAIAPLAVVEDQQFSYTIPAESFKDCDAGDTLTLTATMPDGSALPAWLTFDASSRTLSGTPTNDQVGIQNLLIHATDQNGATVSSSLTLNIANTNDAPLLSAPIADLNTKQGQAFSYQLASDTFRDIDAGDQLTLSASLANGTVLPSWLVFDSATGTFSGTPATAGSFSLQVTATDQSGVTVSDDFSIIVSGGNSAPVVQSDSARLVEDGCPPFVTGNLLTNDRDPDAGDTLKVVDTGIEKGNYGYLALSANGKFGYLLNNLSYDVQSLGRSTQVTDHFDYTVTDGKTTASSSLDIMISGSNDAPLLARYLSDQSVKNNKAFSFTMPGDNFVDIDKGDTLTYTATLADGKALPSWLKFDAKTGTFSGIAPKSAGYINVKVTATDKVAATGSTTGSLSVSDTFELSYGKSSKSSYNTSDDTNGCGNLLDWLKALTSEKPHTPEPFMGRSPVETHEDNRRPNYDLTYLDGKQLDDYLNEFDQVDSAGHNDHLLASRWQAISNALERDLAQLVCDFGDKRHQSGDFRLLAGDGHFGFDRGIADSGSSLIAGSGTILKEFKGLGEGMKRLG